MFFWFLKNVEILNIALKGFVLKLIFQNKRIIKRQLKNKFLIGKYKTKKGDKT